MFGEDNDGDGGWRWFMGIDGDALEVTVPCRRVDVWLGWRMGVYGVCGVMGARLSQSPDPPASLIIRPHVRSRPLVMQPTHLFHPFPLAFVPPAHFLAT